MEDALRLFGADEIIISTHPEGRSHWLEQKVVESARERFAVPITHVVVDLEAEQRRPPEPTHSRFVAATSVVLMKSTSVFASASETWPFLITRAHHARLVALHDLLVRVEDRLEQVRVVGRHRLPVRQLHLEPARPLNVGPLDFEPSSEWQLWQPSEA